MADLEFHSAVIKIREGTPPSETHICNGCVHQQRRRTSSGHTLQECSYFEHHKQIKESVVECNKFYSASLPSLRAMQEIAWMIDINKGKGGKAGFILTPDQWKKTHPNEGDL